MADTIIVNGRLLQRQPPGKGLTARLCVLCHRPFGTASYAVQDDDGVMRTVFAHHACFKKLRAS